MQIVLDNTGRRFNKEWIFKGLNYTFKAGERHAILGPNGSGKSTLLSVLMGNLTPSEGAIEYYHQKPISVEEVFNLLSFAGPYLDLIEDFTLLETIDFHFQFKGLAHGIDKRDVLALLGLEKSADKQLKFFSSGMKQRTKLVLAFCSDSPCLVLDEPTSNLDIQGIDWYHELVNRFAQNKTIIIGSNTDYEYEFCENKLWISDYK